MGRKNRERPDHIVVLREHGNLVILRRWYNPGSAILALTGMVVLYSFWYFFLHPLSDAPNIIQYFIWAAFILFFLPLPLIFAYVGLAGIVNKTIIVVGKGSLSLTHDPMWWPGNASYSTEEIDQLFVAPYKRRVNPAKKHHVAEQEAPQVGHMVDLLIQNTSGKVMTLIKRIPSKEEAQYLERIIEEELGLKDKHVEGEISPQNENLP
ncbi:MAG: hypothetical protein AAFY71_00560 [Bacteroidota bacterium]